MVLAPGQRMLDVIQGEPFYWYVSQRCPCFDPITQDHNHSDPQCNGSGKIYALQPSTNSRGRPLLALCNSVMSARVLEQIGLLEIGNLTCSTWVEEAPIGPDDRIVLPRRSKVADITVTRGNGQSDSLFYPNVTKIVSVITPNGIVDPAQYQLPMPGVSLISGSILWNLGASITAGTQYTVKLRYSPIWEVVVDPTRSVRPDLDGTELTQQVGLKLYIDPRNAPG